MTQKWGQRIDVQRKDRREERKGRKDSERSYRVGKTKTENSAAATGSSVCTAHLSEGASSDREWFFFLISSTGTSSHTKAHSASQGGREEKALLSLAAHTGEAGKTVGSSRPADERVPGRDKMTSTHRVLFGLWQESTSLETYSYGAST